MKRINPIFPVAGIFLAALLASYAQQPTSSGTILRSAPGTPLPNKTTVPSAAAQAGSASGTSAGPSLGAIERSKAPNGVLPGNGAVGPGVVTALPTPSATPTLTQRSGRDRDQRNNTNNAGGFIDPGVPTVVTPGTGTTTTTPNPNGTISRETATTIEGNPVNAGVPVPNGTAPTNSTHTTVRSRTSGTTGGSTSGGTSGTSGTTSGGGTSGSAR